MTLEVPAGMAVAPGGAELGIALYRTGNVGSGRYFPMTETGTTPLAGGGTRYAFRLGEADTARLLSLRAEAAGAGERGAPDAVMITPRFAFCRTGAIPDTQPTIVTSAVAIDTLPDALVAGPTIRTARFNSLSRMERSRDLRDVAALGSGFPPCSDV